MLTTYIPGMSGMLGSVIHVRSSDNVTAKSSNLAK